MKQLLYWLLVGVCGLYAGEAYALVISPLRYELTLDPGKEQVVAVTIKNDTDERKTYRAHASGAKQAPEGHPIFGEGFDVLETWVEPREMEVTLEPNETRKVFFTVSAPINSAPGTHTGAILVGQATETNVSAQAATLLAVTVAGTVHEALSIEGWKVDSILTTRPKNTLELTFKNNGTVALPVSGKVSIVNMSGIKVYEKPLVLGNSMLPGSSRTIKTDLTSLPLTVGPYKAVAHLQYGRSQSVTTAELTFWYLPLWVFGAFGALIAISMGARLTKR